MRGRGKRRNHIHAIFSRSLPHIGNHRFIGFEWNALLELPTEHRLGFLRRARKLIEMLHENADNGIGNDQRDFFILGTKPREHSGDRRLSPRSDRRYWFPPPKAPARHWAKSRSRSCPVLQCASTEHRQRDPAKFRAQAPDAAWPRASARPFAQTRSDKCPAEMWRYCSTKVTLLISFTLVTPSRILAKPLSRNVIMPSSRATRLISEVGRRSTIISRMRSVRSSNSQIAVRP